MAERPILFSGLLVQAILSGTKTQTRRVITKSTAQAMGADRKPVRVFSALDLSDAHRTPPPRLPAPQSPRLVATHGVSRSKYMVSSRIHAGDTLWVRETWAVGEDLDHVPPSHLRESERFPLWYRTADPAPEHDVGRGKWRPSIHMPRWASRISLEVTEVRVERVQDITEEDARAEGVERIREWDEDDMAVDPYGPDNHGYAPPLSSYRRSFELLWDAINGKRPGCAWDANPWVFAISFRRIEA